MPTPLPDGASVAAHTLTPDPPAPPPVETRITPPTQPAPTYIPTPSPAPSPVFQAPPQPAPLPTQPVITPAQAAAIFGPAQPPSTPAVVLGPGVAGTFLATGATNAPGAGFRSTSPSASTAAEELPDKSPLTGRTQWRDVHDPTGRNPPGPTGPEYVVGGPRPAHWYYNPLSQSWGQDWVQGPGGVWIPSGSNVTVGGKNIQSLGDNQFSVSDAVAPAGQFTAAASPGVASGVSLTPGTQAATPAPTPGTGPTVPLPPAGIPLGRRNLSTLLATPLPTIVAAGVGATRGKSTAGNLSPVRGNRRTNPTVLEPRTGISAQRLGRI